MTHVASLIKDKRVQLGISGAALARALRVTRAYVSSVERSLRPCPFDWILDLSSILKLNQGALLRAFVLDYENECIFRLKLLKKNQ